jgi:hypothetical protein
MTQVAKRDYRGDDDWHHGFPHHFARENRREKTLKNFCQRHDPKIMVCLRSESGARSSSRMAAPKYERLASPPLLLPKPVFDGGRISITSLDCQ